MDNQQAERFSERLAELGLQADVSSLRRAAGGDGLLTVQHEYASAVFEVSYVQSLTGSVVAERAGVGPEGVPQLWLGQRITERSAALLRSVGINFLDQDGNAFINFQGIHVDVRGRRSAQSSAAGPSVLARGRGGINLMSAKRAQVILAILEWETLLRGTVRDIAYAARVSTGQAQGTLTLLVELGYLDEQRHLVDSRRDSLNALWFSAFPAGLGAPARTVGFTGDLTSLDAEHADVSVSGELAVSSLLRPETAVVYADEPPLEIMRAGRWRRDDANPNILLRKPFWRVPRQVETPPLPGVIAAPQTVILADLLASNDSRQELAARSLMEARNV